MELGVENLSVARGGVAVLEGVSFRLRAGEALVLRGPNGIGKTTLLRTVAGLQPPLSGRVAASPETVVYAGHSDGIKSMLTVDENLTFWSQVFDTEGVSAALAGFDLASLRTRQAGALSAGQKRRLGLARLLVTGRPIWVLDEPTVSLDTEAVSLFVHAVRAHLAAGGAALLATHIDLGLEEAQGLDLEPFRAKVPAPDDFDGAFL